MRRRAVMVLALGALTLAGGAGGAGKGGTPIAFVAIPTASEVSAVYLGTGRVVARVRVPRGPQELAVYSETERRQFVLVTSPAAGAVTMIDAVTRRVLKVWRGFGHPNRIDVEGARAYVTDTSRGQLVVLDLRSRQVRARIHVGGAPAAVAAADLIVIADELRPQLTLVDAARRHVVARLPVADVVTSVSKRPDTAEVILAHRDGSVARLDWGRRRVLFRRNVGTLASDVVVDYFDSDRLFVSDETEGRVRVLSARRVRPIRRIGGCKGAHRLALVHPWRIVATCPGDASLIDWDTMSGQLRRTPLGGSPGGVAFVLLS